MLDGLAAAHRVGVIHRDFKSSNVMLVFTGGRVRAILTDFGLARAVKVSNEGVPLTKRRPIGTIDYMSPEQIKGEQVTETSDIYALGIVIYEMLTGRRPFTGDSNVTIALKHINESPRPPRDLVPEINPAWDKLILGCLEKNPKYRLRTADAVKAALPKKPGIPNRKRHLVPVLFWSSIGLPILIGSFLFLRNELAHLLPFGTAPGSLPHQILIADVENHTGDALLDHTVRELVISVLEQSTKMKLFPLTRIPEVLRRMGKPPLTPITTELAVEISEREGLDAFIVGSVSRIENGYIILFNAVDRKGEVLANITETARSQADLISAIQRALNTLRAKLGESIKSINGTVPLERVTSPSLQAVQYYSLGKLELYSGNPGNAINFFGRAIETDPNFAMAHCYAGIAFEHLNDIASWHRELAQAVRLSDRVAEPERLKILGDYNLAIQDYVQSLKYYRLLAKVKPDEPAARLNLGQAYLGLFKFEQALAETDEAIRNGAEVSFQNNAAEILLLAERPDEAIERAYRVLKSHPDDFRARYIIGRSHLARGEMGSAQRIFEQLSGIEGINESMARAALADIALARGHSDQARRELNYAFVADSKAHNTYGMALRTLARQSIELHMNRSTTQLDFKVLQPVEDEDRILILAARLCLDSQNAANLQRVLALLERLQRSRETPTRQSFLAIAKSYLALLQKRNTAALDYAVMAVQFEKSTFALDVLARTHVARGMYKEGISEFEQVLSRADERMETYDAPAFHRLKEIHRQLSELYLSIGDRTRSYVHARLAAHNDL